jgi:hypothetical protein
VKGQRQFIRAIIQLYHQCTQGPLQLFLHNPDDSNRTVPVGTDLELLEVDSDDDAHAGIREIPHTASKLGQGGANSRCQRLVVAVLISRLGKPHLCLKRWGLITSSANPRQQR